MESVLLIMVLLLIGILGYFFMKKAASFLEGYEAQGSSYNISVTQITVNKKVIIIMFCEEKVDLW